jgi:hemolysin III
LSERQQCVREEIAHSVSHGVALLAAILAVPFLISTTRNIGTANLVGICVFSGTMVLLYTTSTLYHALPTGRAKRAVLKLDHGAIYFFIAGSYTPFALGAPIDSWSWPLLGLVWSFAIAGAMLKAYDRLSHPWLSTGLYVVMGWLVLIAVLPLVGHVPLPSVVLLIAGGFAYTVGVVFFMLDSRLHYAHAVWYCFVMLGSGCHFFAVLRCAA